MSTSRPFAYNPSQTSIPGIDLFGYLSVGPTGSGKITGLTTWNGPNEDLGYIIAKVVPGNTQPTPIAGVSASVGFYRSSTFSEAAFLYIVNRGLHLNYSVGTDASYYLLNNGYWTNYPTFSYDTDAVIYFNALSSAGYFTSSYEKEIINTLFLDLKAVGLYTKMEGFYPMIGTTAATQKLNAKSVGGVRQSNYDLTFAGGWIFDSTGAQGNIVNTYISVGSSFSNKEYSDLPSLINTHFAVYGGVSSNGSGISPAYDVYAYDQAGEPYVTMRLSEFTNYYYPYGYAGIIPSSYPAVYDYPGGASQYNNGISTNESFVVMSYDNYFLDGTNNFIVDQIPYTNTSTSPTDPISSIPPVYLSFGHWYEPNGGGGFYHHYTGNKYGWLGFGTNLDTFEEYNYQSIVNTFMTIFGKNTY